MSGRIPITHELAAEVLYLSDRTCCVCNVPGRPVQIHHVDDNPSNNALGNLAVLCLDCHNETQQSGGFGRQLTAAQVIRYRDAWLERVRLRRGEADRLAVASGIAVTQPFFGTGPSSLPVVPSRTGMVAYIRIVPTLLRAAYDAARPRWDTGVTAEVVEGAYQVVEVLELILVGLARFYPHGHFDVRDPKDYFSELISTRFRWHRYHRSTEGMGFTGTIVGPLVAGDVLQDLQLMVEDIVLSLTAGDLPDENFRFEDWIAEWRQSRGSLPPAL